MMNLRTKYIILTKYKFNIYLLYTHQNHHLTIQTNSNKLKLYYENSEILNFK